MSSVLVEGLMAQEPVTTRTSVAVQVALVLLLLVGALGCYLIYGMIEQILLEISQIVDQQPKVALRMGNRLLLWLILFFGAVLAVIGFYLLQLSRAISKAGQFPPPNIPVAIPTQIIRGQDAERQARNYRWLAFALWMLVLVMLGFWYWFTGGLI